MMPMMTPCQGSTNPDAGVMVPRPATAPVIMPRTDGFPRVHHSRNIQLNAPLDAARWVAVIAKTARDVQRRVELDVPGMVDAARWVAVIAKTARELAPSA